MQLFQQPGPVLELNGREMDPVRIEIEHNKLIVLSPAMIEITIDDVRKYVK